MVNAGLVTLLSLNSHKQILVQTLIGIVFFFFLSFFLSFLSFNFLVLPYFDYCDVVWTGLNKGLSDRIDKLYNRAARIITQSDWETRSVFVWKILQWDTHLEFGVTNTVRS